MHCKREKNKFTTHTNTRISTRTLFLRAFEIRAEDTKEESERTKRFKCISVAGEEIKKLARYLT